MKFRISAAVFVTLMVADVGYSQTVRSNAGPLVFAQSDSLGTLPEVEVRPPKIPDPAPPTPTVPKSDPIPSTPPQVTPPQTENSSSDTLEQTEALGSNTTPENFSQQNFSQQNSNQRNSSQNTGRGNSNPMGFPSLRDQKLGGTTSDSVGLNNVLRSDASILDLPQSVSIVDRNTLDQRQSSTVFRALQNEVGVLLQQTGNGQLSPYIRGLTGQQILVLVDGIRMNTSILRGGPNQYAATIDPGMVERIEIVRGAESARWGSDAIGGAINIVTRSADPNRGDHLSPIFSQFYSTAEASSYTRTGFGGWYGKTGIIGGISYLDTGLLDRGGGLGRQPGTDYEQYAADIKLQRILGDNHILTTAFQHFEQEDLKRSDRYLPFVLGPAPNGSIPVQRPTIFDPQQRDLAYIRLEGILDESFTLADAYSMTLSGSRTKEGSVVDRYANNLPTSQPNRREIGEFDDWGWGAQISASKSLDEYGKLTFGSDYYGENIDSTRQQINNPTNPASVPTVIDPQYPDDAQAARVGTFLSWNVLLTERLDMTASTRYENIDLSGTPRFNTIGPLHFERTYQDWIGSMGLTYKVTDDFRLIGGIYEGFRAPTIDDLTANKTSLQNNQSVPLIGNLAAQPEHSITYEAGFKMDREKWRLQVVEFWTDFDSYLSRDIIAGNEFLTNQEAYINGTEVNGEYLLQPEIAIHGNFFYTYGDLITQNDFLTRIPPTQGTLGIRFDQPTRKSYVDIFTWMVGRADRYNDANLSDVRFIPGGTPGYATLNARVGRNFGKSNKQQVSLSLENITDKYYRVLGSGVDGAGFNAVFGYQYRY